MANPDYRKLHSKTYDYPKQTPWDGILPGSEYNLREVGAYHMIGDDGYEPQRSNNFEIHIYGLDNLYSVDRTYKLSSDVQKELTLSVASVGGLNFDTNPIEVAYGNTKVKYAGLPSVGNTDITFNDYIGKSTERIITAWYGLVFNPKTQTIKKATDYKKRAILIETDPEGNNSRAWELQGCWPSSVHLGAYDYNNGGIRQITMTLTYDIMIPIDKT